MKKMAGLKKWVATGAVLATGLFDASAANQQWTGSTNGNWDTTTNNWTGAVPWTNGNTATFTAAGANQNITIGSGVSVLSSGGNGVTVSGGSYTFGGSALTVSNFNGDSVVATSGTGSIVFNTGIDVSTNTQGTLRFTPSGGNITLNNGASLGARQLQLGFFTTGGSLNFAGGTFSTTNQIVATHSLVNITGTTTLSTTSAYSQANGTVNVNGAGVTFSSASDANSVSFGRTRNTAAFNVQQGSATFSGGLSLMNVEENATTGNTATLAVSGGRLTVGGAGASGGINLIRNAGALVDRDGSAVFTQSNGVTTTTRINFGLGGSVDTGTSATVNVTGGELYIGAGGITKNATYATLTTAINLSGGTVGADADWSSNQNISLSNANGGVTFKTARENNTSQNITLSGVLSGNGPVGKSGTGTLLLQGINTYTGNTVVSAGTFQLADNAGLTFVIGASGVNNGISGTGTAIFDGDFTFNLSGADTNGTWTIVNNSTLAEVFNSTFQVFGWTDNLNNTWSTVSGGSTYTFDEGTGVLTAVPEPSTYALMGLGMASLWILRRRNRRS